MNQCPFCLTELSPKDSTCSDCQAKKGYFQIDQFVLGKTLMIIFGIIAPLYFAFLGLAAQNPFGLGVCLFMLFPVLFTGLKLMIGRKWYKLV